MANNYLQFSTLFLLKDEKQVEEAMKIIRKTAIEYLVENDYADGDEFDEESMGFNGTSFEPDGNDIWIYGDEYGDPNLVAEVVKELLEHFKIDDPFYMGWALTCSKPRLDEFGGGAMCIRRGKEPLFIDAENQIREMAKYAADGKD